MNGYHLIEMGEIVRNYVPVKRSNVITIQEFRAAKRHLEQLLEIPWGEGSRRRTEQVHVLARNYKSGNILQMRRARDLARLCKIQLTPGFSLPEEFTGKPHNLKRLHKKTRRKIAEFDNMGAEIKALNRKVFPDDAA